MTVTVLGHEQAQLNVSDAAKRGLEKTYSSVLVSDQSGPAKGDRGTSWQRPEGLEKPWHLSDPVVRFEAVGRTTAV